MAATAESTPFGIMARFATTAEIFHAAEQVRDEGFRKWDVYTPFPVHGMDDAMGLKRSTVPRATFLGGITGFLLGFALANWMNGIDYPLVVGGKPLVSPVYPFPVMYELNILLAGLGTFFGMFLWNFLPRHFHPSFNHPTFDKASDDAFFIVIEKRDPLFNEEKTRTLLESLGGKEVQMVDG